METKEGGVRVGTRVFTVSGGRERRDPKVDRELQ